MARWQWTELFFIIQLPRKIQCIVGRQAISHVHTGSALNPKVELRWTSDAIFIKLVDTLMLPSSLNMILQSYFWTEHQWSKIGIVWAKLHVCPAHGHGHGHCHCQFIRMNKISNASNLASYQNMLDHTLSLSQVPAQQTVEFMWMIKLHTHSHVHLILF